MNNTKRSECGRQRQVKKGLTIGDSNKMAQNNVKSLNLAPEQLNVEN